VNFPLVSLPVCKKENTDVTKTMKHTTLPEGMALVETANGRWFAAYTSMSERLLRVHLVEEPPLIPPALDSYYAGGTGYDCREEALAACYAWHEVPELTKHWQELAAHTELYPERNAWYLDEITHLVGENIPRFHYGLCVQAVVCAKPAQGKSGLECITATGDTPDEAIEALYKYVYEWSRMLHDRVCSRS
jgi:hypothetical protein